MLFSPHPLTNNNDDTITNNNDILMTYVYIYIIYIHTYTYIYIYIYICTHTHMYTDMSHAALRNRTCPFDVLGSTLPTSTSVATWTKRSLAITARYAGKKRGTLYLILPEGGAFLQT